MFIFDAVRHKGVTMEDLSWVEKELYTCDACGKDFPLGEMRGGYNSLKCEECYNKPTKNK